MRLVDDSGALCDIDVDETRDSGVIEAWLDVLQHSVKTHRRTHSWWVVYYSFLYLRGSDWKSQGMFWHILAREAAED